MAAFRERHTFHSSLDTFTVVMNAHKIAAISDERDKAVKENMMNATFFDLLSNGAFPHRVEKMKWGEKRGFGSLFSTMLDIV